MSELLLPTWRARSLPAAPRRGQASASGPTDGQGEATVEAQTSSRRRRRRIEAVTFDFGSTLGFHPDREARKRKRKALNKWLRSHGASIEKESFKRVLSTASGIHTLSDCADDHGGAARAMEYMLQELRLNLHPRERIELKELVEDLFRENRYRPVEGVSDVLRLLHTRDVRLGIVSNRGPNGVRIRRKELETIGLARFFEPAAISCSNEAGFRKPEPGIFLRSLGALRTAPESAAHVGNAKLEDAVGARRLGMFAVRYAGVRDDDDDATPDADAVIRSYEELPRVLGL